MKNVKSLKSNSGKNVVKASGVHALDRSGVNSYINYIKEQAIAVGSSLDSFDHLGYGKNKSAI